jgi:hypothetical protein
VYHKDFICEIKEEIILFNKETSLIESLVTIIECAENDLNKESHIWLDSDKASRKIDFFSNEKLVYLFFNAI